MTITLEQTQQKTLAVKEMKDEQKQEYATKLNRYFDRIGVGSQVDFNDSASLEKGIRRFQSTQHLANGGSALSVTGQIDERTAAALKSERIIEIGEKLKDLGIISPIGIKAGTSLAKALFPQDKHLLALKIT